MMVSDIFIKFLDEEITYDEAMKKIDENDVLDKDEKEKYKKRIKKLAGKPLTDNPLDQRNQLSGLPNDMYLLVLMETIAMVRQGFNTSDIAMKLYNSYRINSFLIQYFVNEALHIYRMNTYTEQEFNQIGSQYMDVVLEAAGLDPKRIKRPMVKFVEGNSEEPNAEEIHEIIEEDGEDE